MRLKVQSFHRTGMLADWMVIPRSRSAGKKSVVVLPVSTDPADDKYCDCKRIDSVSVVFPESGVCHEYTWYRSFQSCTPMWATRAMLRNLVGSCLA